MTSVHVPAPPRPAAPRDSVGFAASGRVLAKPLQQLLRQPRPCPARSRSSPGVAARGRRGPEPVPSSRPRPATGPAPCRPRPVPPGPRPSRVLTSPGGGGCRGGACRGRGRAGKVPGASSRETLVTHLQPPGFRLGGRPGPGPDSAKVTPWGGSPSTCPPTRPRSSEGGGQPLAVC